MGKKNTAQNTALSIFFSVLSILWLCPIALVVLNSFKKKAYISRRPFAIPTDKMFVGLENYINGIEKTGFFEAFGWTLFITIGSVFVIILCTSMCAWYIVRVKNTFTSVFYYLCLFSMIVPFQMVMFPLSKKVWMGVQPSIMAASSISRGIDFTKPVNINTESPAPNPR